MLDLFKKDPRKQLRFQRPEFQEKLFKARRFMRRSQPIPETFWGNLLPKIGLGSRIARILFGIFAVAVIYFLTISKVFLINKVQMNAGNPQEVTDVLERLNNQRIYLIPKSHILLLTQKKLLAELQKEFPRIKSVTHYKRILPNRIEIGLKERESIYIWKSGDNYYLMDQDGVIFQKITNFTPETFPQILITDQTAEVPTVGQALDVRDALNFTGQLNQHWPKEIRDIGFVGIIIPAQKSLDIFVKTSVGFQVYFDLKRSAAVQLANLRLILNQEIKPETYTGLSYVDLRLQNIAYYCYLDAPCAPENATSTSPQL
mgnify:CR=1 FL=1